MHTGLYIQYAHTHRHAHTQIPVSRGLYLPVMRDTSAPALTRRTFTVHTSHEPANCPLLLSTVHRLDWQLQNVWALWHVRECNLSDKQLSVADSDWLVWRGGGRQQIRETESNREVADVISVSVSFLLIRLPDNTNPSLWASECFYLFTCISKNTACLFINEKNIIPYFLLQWSFKVDLQAHMWDF